MVSAKGKLRSKVIIQTSIIGVCFPEPLTTPLRIAFHELCGGNHVGDGRLPARALPAPEGNGNGPHRSGLRLGGQNPSPGDIATAGRSDFRYWSGGPATGGGARIASRLADRGAAVSG